MLWFDVPWNFVRRLKVMLDIFDETQFLYSILLSLSTTYSPSQPALWFFHHPDKKFVYIPFLLLLSQACFEPLFPILLLLLILLLRVIKFVGFFDADDATVHDLYWNYWECVIVSFNLGNFFYYVLKEEERKSFRSTRIILPSLVFYINGVHFLMN